VFVTGSSLIEDQRTYVRKILIIKSTGKKSLGESLNKMFSSMISLDTGGGNYDT
jgi:hypothetical protein